MSKSVSATNLAAYQHFNCDLYIYQVHHGTPESTSEDVPEVNQVAELAKAQFKRGLEWENTLFTWLDVNNLLVTVYSPPLDGTEIVGMISADERVSDSGHFFVAGITFWPPQRAFDAIFAKYGSSSVKFGLAKPDLIEIWRSNDGNVTWRVIDAKASREAKTSHHIQIYFYTLCLEHLLDFHGYSPATSIGIWLPPSTSAHDAFPSFDDIKTVPRSILRETLTPFIFKRIPDVLSLSHDDVDWHFNPLCTTCPFRSICREKTFAKGTLGVIPNISFDFADVLQRMLARAHRDDDPRPGQISDIEDLHATVSSKQKMEYLQRSVPQTMRSVKRLLAISDHKSPLIEAARTRSIQVIKRRNMTCPRSEDVAIVCSVIQDPASQEVGYFYISIFSSIAEFATAPPKYGTKEQLVPALAGLIRSILDLQSPGMRPMRTQFYVGTQAEHTTLQSHLIHTALITDPYNDEAISQIKLCIGALCEGASLLATSFQPIVLSGALLDFLGRRGGRSKPELQICAERLGLPTNGTADVLRGRVKEYVEYLKARQEKRTDHSRSTEIGQLPKIVVILSEVERQLALPIPGYLELASCVGVLLPGIRPCPSEEEVFTAYRHQTESELNKILAYKNQCLDGILMKLRTILGDYQASYPGSMPLLVNDARVLSADLLEICRNPYLSKLFLMQQFEVLAKLNDLWKARLDGCVDSPVLKYRSSNPGAGLSPTEHHFILSSGNLDLPSSDRVYFNWLLVEDQDGDLSIPPECFFDDIGIASLFISLNRYTKAKWFEQHPLVQQKILLADVRDISEFQNETRVVINTWGSFDVQPVEGRTYRLSPRLVDFNTTKILSTLLEMDLQDSVGEDVPFVRLLENPKSFAVARQADAEITRRILKEERAIQSLFNQLSQLDAEAAGSLIFKTSQRKCAKLILTKPLAVCWGPPGTGKTYTIALSLLRFLDVQSRLGEPKQFIIFLTAMTHAAIEAAKAKLLYLINCYRRHYDVPQSWLRRLQVEHVQQGATHALPNVRSDTSYIYLGTVYQLHSFGKRAPFEVDCIVIDESGQLAVGTAALALRCIGPNGKIVIAGDSEQLAPILSRQYPKLESRLFGSILDCVMSRWHTYRDDAELHSQSISFGTEPSELSQESTIVQLTENFRLNPDLGEFVSLIYSKPFKAQKSQTRQVAMQFTTLKDVLDNVDGREHVRRQVLEYLLALSNVMLRKHQTVLRPPQRTQIRASDEAYKDIDVPNSVSLALVRLRTVSRHADQIGYETHVRGEAAVAAALVHAIRQCTDDTIFVATPHRIQRQAVKEAVRSAFAADLNEQLNSLTLTEEPAKGVIIDTVERLQGSEAAFVICLFSLPKSSASSTQTLKFLLDRPRLNVAISRAKTLCLIITSQAVLQPSVRVLADQGTLKGYAFLRAFEQRAWSAEMKVDLDKLK